MGALQPQPALHPARSLFCSLSYRQSSVTSVFLFLDYFAVFAVIPKAATATFSPGLSTTVSGLHSLRGCEWASTFVEKPAEACVA